MYLGGNRRWVPLFGPCGAQVEKVREGIKKWRTKKKQKCVNNYRDYQKYHNKQLLVTLSEMVGFYCRY